MGYIYGVYWLYVQVNNYDHNVFNGTVGKVTEVSSSTEGGNLKSVHVRFDSGDEDAPSLVCITTYSTCITISSPDIIFISQVACTSTTSTNNSTACR